MSLYRMPGKGSGIGSKKKLARWPVRHVGRRERKTYRKTIDPNRREKEAFTGLVEGKTASDLEERFYNMLRERPDVDAIRFRTTYEGMTRTSFGAIELDFLFRASGQWFAVQVDEEYFHSSAQQQARDQERSDRLLEILKGYGISHINRVESKWIDTQEFTKLTIQEIIHGRRYE